MIGGIKIQEYLDSNKNKTWNYKNLMSLFEIPSQSHVSTHEMSKNRGMKSQERMLKNYGKRQWKVL